MTNWLEKVVALNVKENSLRNYKIRRRLYIEPYLGNDKVQEITPAAIDKFMRELTAQGFSKNVLISIHSLLSHALDYAVYPAQIISSNPAKYIKVSKKAPSNVVQRTIITKERFNELLEKYPSGSAMYIPLLLLYHTGMRISEVCGLTWDDIDFGKKVITLKSRIVYINGRGYSLTTLKTKTGAREIAMDKFLINELQRWKSRQSENEVELTDEYVYIYRNSECKIIQQSRSLPLNLDRVGLVCTHKNGRMVSKCYISENLSTENLNAHSFRHTHATILIENGATPKGVAGRLGHSNAMITQNLYTHNTKRLQDDTMAIFEKTLQTNP